MVEAGLHDGFHASGKIGGLWFGRKDQGDDRADGGAEASRCHAIDRQQPDGRVMAVAEKSNHGRGISSQKAGIGGRAGEQISRAGAQAEPEHKADNDGGRVVACQNHETDADQCANDRAGDAGKAALQPLAVRRKSSDPDGHRCPLRVIEPDQGADSERQAGCDCGPRGEAQSGRINIEDGGKCFHHWVFILASPSPSSLRRARRCSAWPRCPRR
ncbi:hypothetical protein D3C71_1280260 [compost metagenome]